MEKIEMAVESVVRDSYGRLIAYLSVRTNDVAGAEDALSEAVLAALQSWPRDGVPRRPEAWILTTARRKLIDWTRHRQVEVDNALFAGSNDQMGSPEKFPDERLKLLFACAHPAINSAVHTPLMLQTVLGLNAERIARAFLVSPRAMNQRLVRAKAKIRKTSIAFEVPEDSELPERLESVLDAVYVAFGSSWEESVGAPSRRQSLADDAIWLARLLVKLMPNEPEVRGLLALMLYCDSRRKARRESGRYVPLSEQDVRLWSPSKIQEAEQEVMKAARFFRPGRFQLEAAIQSVHTERARTGRTDWKAIAMFYDQLIGLAPTVGSQIGRAAAIAELEGAEAGLLLLGEVAPSVVVTYQPYWAVRAHLLGCLNRVGEAIEAFDRAVGLSEDEAVRSFLLGQRIKLIQTSNSSD